MATVTIQTPNVTKNYSLDAGQVQRLLDFAEHHIGESTTAQKEAWIAQHFMILMRDALFSYERAKAQSAAASGVSPIQVTEV